mgnify:CR=1 FL=1
MTKWVIELDEFDITYQSRIAIKAQTLIDFIAELTPKKVNPYTSATSRPWIMYMNGSYNKEGKMASMLFIISEGYECTYTFRFSFHVSNNEAEYETLITKLNIAQKLGFKI